MHKFRPLYVEWTLEFTTNVEDLRVNGQICKGAVHYKDRRVCIDKNLSKVDMYKVIRHELTHVVLYETQLDLNRNYTEEDLCELMAKYGAFIISETNEIMDKYKE